MSNKRYLQSNKKIHYQAPNFALNLTDSQQIQLTPLVYSLSRQSSQLDITQPQTRPFCSKILSNNSMCMKRDCLDRKFEAIRRLSSSQQLNRSQPVVGRMVSPRKIDIILKDDLIQSKNQLICIHSSKSLQRKASTSKNQLKEFKQIEEMRRDLKSRNQKKINRFYFLVNPRRPNTSPNAFMDKINPETAGMEMRAKTSQRYRQKNRSVKESQFMHTQIKFLNQFFNQICSGRSLRHRLSHQ